jgi:hypothetical protein
LNNWKDEMTINSGREGCEIGISHRGEHEEFRFRCITKLQD